MIMKLNYIDDLADVAVPIQTLNRFKGTRSDYQNFIRRLSCGFTDS